MTSALGLLGLIAYISCTIALAAAITWLVVKLSPARKPADTETRPTGS
jgi:hypothetical protein